MYVAHQVAGLPDGLAVAAFHLAEGQLHALLPDDQQRRFCVFVELGLDCVGVVGKLNRHFEPSFLAKKSPGHAAGRVRYRNRISWKRSMSVFPSIT